MDVEPDADRPPLASAPPSFDEWVAARAPSLLRFAYVVTGSQHAAEDAVQDALARACERWARVGRTLDPDTYVRRMIVNAHISRRRRTRRESPVEAVLAADPQPDHADRLGPATRCGRSAAGSRRGSAPRSCCGSTKTSSTPRSRGSWTAPRRRFAPTSTARSPRCAPE